MPYVRPEKVVAPRSFVRSVQVIYDTGAGGWSVARLNWDGDQDALGIRWNGNDEDPGIGNPQSRGKPTWFVVPEELRPAILSHVEQLTYSRPGGLLDQYRDMAADTERESQAQDWSEALISDAASEER